MAKVTLRYTLEYLTEGGESFSRDGLDISCASLFDAQEAERTISKTVGEVAASELKKIRKWCKHIFVSATDPLFRKRLGRISQYLTQCLDEDKGLYCQHCCIAKWKVRGHENTSSYVYADSG